MKRLYAVFFVLLIASQVFAQITQSSIENVIDENGKIKKGISGSFNASGYKLTYGKNNEPILKKRDPNQIQSNTWSTMGQLPGTNGIVHVVAVDSNGIVYIGGEFGWPHNRLARWDGVSWESIGAFNGYVYTIAINGSDVYVGGAFTDVNGNSSIKKIAKWNGSSWSNLGTEFSGVYVTAVYSIAVNGTDIYVGGEFTVTINSVDYLNIAKWDGTSWYGVGSGVDGFGVRSLVVDGSGNVYAGGRFTNAGGRSANYIAKWDGTAWSNLGTGLNNEVYTVAVDGSGNIYAGGIFTQAGGSTANLIAKWNGTSWSELGGGVTSSYSSVNSIHVDGSDIYVGGVFQTVGSNSISNIAKWNGSAWSSLGQGTGDVNSIISYNNDFYVGGNFSQAGNILAYNIAKWDGFNWSPLGNGPTNQGGLTSNVYAIAVDGSDIYFGGDFTQAGGIEANHIVTWDGNTWIPLGSGTNGVNGTVYSIVVIGQNIYVGGTFGVAGGGTTTSYIARWAKPSELDPTGGWHSLVDGSYEGVNGYVRAMVYNPSDGLLYVGGNFTSAANKTAYYVAKWNGTQWSPIVSAWPDAVNNYVLALDVNSTGDIYLGGGFSQVAGITANRIAKWDGTNWSALGNGLDADVYAIEVDGSNVYAGGQFHWSNTTYLNGIGKWDGTSWSPLGDGVDGTPYSIVANGGYVYVGGDFTGVYNSNVDRIGAQEIARFDGTSWTAIGNGTIGAIRAQAISLSEGSMYVGGEFIALGDYYTGSAYTAKFTDSQNPLPVELVSFNAELKENSVELNWRTAIEVNNYGFEVERACIHPQNRDFAAVTWEKIAFVDGTGNSNIPKEYSFVDNSILKGKYQYRLKQIDIDGNYKYSDIVEININSELPAKFELSQNYPNPFNPSTAIRYSLPVRQAGIPAVDALSPVEVHVSLIIYDVLGNEVSTLVNENQPAGNYEVTFNASGLASGVYLYRLKTSNGFAATKKLMLMK